MKSRSNWSVVSTLHCGVTPLSRRRAQTADGYAGEIRGAPVIGEFVAHREHTLEIR